MYELHASLPAEQAIAVFGVIDTLAKAAKVGREPGDDRGIDAIRADVLVDLITNPNGEQRVKYEIRVLVPAGTLLSLGDEDGHLPGHGPIPAALCRELAATVLSESGTWKRILTDPNMAHVLDVGAHTYKPSARMRECIEARDQHCRFPGCRRNAHHSDIDHTIEFEINGLTVRANPSALCLKHHQIKHFRDWDLVQELDGSGVLTFVAPTGQMHRTRPPTPLGEELPLEWLTLRASEADPPQFPYSA